jgi:hypothetical protein
MRPLLLSAMLLSTFGASLPAGATTLFTGDFETGDLSQWTKAQVVAADRIQVVASPRRQGSFAARFEVRQGDDPINASGNRAELVWSKNPETEGSERWYGWSTLWPEGYPSEKTWQLFTQWHHSGCCGSPPMELYVNGETIYLRVNASQVVWSEPLVRGKWHDFVMHVKWSSSASVGYVELWYDGKLALPKTYGKNLYAGEVNTMKIGLYRNATIQPVGVLYHDGMRVGTSREEVELAVEPPSSPPDPGPVGGSAGAAGSDGAAGAFSGYAGQPARQAGSAAGSAGASAIEAPSSGGAWGGRGGRAGDPVGFDRPEPRGSTDEGGRAACNVAQPGLEGGWALLLMLLGASIVRRPPSRSRDSR